MMCGKILLLFQILKILGRLGPQNIKLIWSRLKEIYIYFIHNSVSSLQILRNIMNKQINKINGEQIVTSTLARARGVQGCDYTPITLRIIYLSCLVLESRLFILTNRLSIILFFQRKASC